MCTIARVGGGRPWWGSDRPWLILPVGAVIGLGLALWRVGNLDGSLDWPTLLTPAMRRRWVLPGLVLAVCIWLGLVTWGRVRGLRERPATRVTYRYGILGFGGAWGVLMVLLRSVAQVRALAAGGQPSWSLVSEVVLREAVIAFPLALWAGYVVGRVLTTVFGRLGVPRR